MTFPSAVPFFPLVLFMSQGIDDGLQLLMDRRQIRSCIPAEAVCALISVCTVICFSFLNISGISVTPVCITFFGVFSSNFVFPLIILKSVTEWPWQSVYFGLFQLWISLATLCYVGNWGKKLHFMMVKFRGSSDLIFIIMHITKYWPEKVCINTSVVRQNKTGTETASIFQIVWC